MWEYQVEFFGQGSVWQSVLISPLPIPLLAESELSPTPMKVWHSAGGAITCLEFDLGYKHIRVYNHPFMLRDYSGEI